MRIPRIAIFVPVLAGLIPALPIIAADKPAYETVGNILRLEPELDKLIPGDAAIEKLAEGFAWSEGPVWMERGDYLLFSDVPGNVIHRWKEGEGLKTYLRPSGYTGPVPRPGGIGSNGLAVDRKGRLVICRHGDREIAVQEKSGYIKPLATHFDGKRFNSPNDLCYRSNGDLYFTDPPYGLPKKNDDPTREIPFNGVYRLDRKGNVDLLTREIEWPNGIAFSPNQKILYVAESHPKTPRVWAFDVTRDGTLENGRIFFDATPLKEAGGKGSCDGLKLDRKGNLFVTGPGGVLVLSPDGKHLGTIHTGQATANCAWGDNGSTLYLTSNMWLCRIRTSTRGD